MNTQNENTERYYMNPLAGCDDVPEAGDEIKARRSNLFGESPTDVLKIVDVEEQEVSCNPLSMTHNHRSDFSTTTHYTITLEDPTGHLHQVRCWASNFKSDA